MLFDFTQFWLNYQPGNEYFQISHKISDLLTPLTPLGVHPQWFETTVWNRFERFLLLWVRAFKYLPYTKENNLWCFDFRWLHTFKKVKKCGNNWSNVGSKGRRTFYKLESGKSKKGLMSEISLLKLLRYWLFTFLCQESRAWLWLKLEKCRNIPHWLTLNKILLIHITQLCLLYFFIIFPNLPLISTF